MPQNDAQRLAARRVQNTLHVDRTTALHLVDQAKTDEINWGQAADLVITERAGDGFPEVTQ